MTDEQFHIIKLIRNVISRGLYVGVDNGEGEPSFPSRDETALLQVLDAGKDGGKDKSETLRLYRLDAGGLHYVGFFFIVEGLLNAHSDNRLCHSIWGEVFGRELAV